MFEAMAPANPWEEHSLLPISWVSLSIVPVDGQICLWLHPFQLRVCHPVKLRGYAQQLMRGKDGIMLVTMLEYIRQLSDPWKEQGLHVDGETCEKTFEDRTG